MRCLGLLETSLRLVGSCDPPVFRRIFRFIERTHLHLSLLQQEGVLDTSGRLPGQNLALETRPPGAVGFAQTYIIYIYSSNGVDAR